VGFEHCLRQRLKCCLDNPNSSTFYLKSDAFFSLASSWLKTCSKTHGECNIRYDSHFKPTRLIDVGSLGKAPRLIETSETDIHDEKYLALSYCWGSPPVGLAKTTTRNISQRRKAISMKTLPRTYRDAITVTRRLGLRYLWIDAFCVLQNSMEDWEHESSLMGKVYSHCFCMLAAAAAKNCHEGLFPVKSALPILGAVDRKSSSPSILIKSAYPGWDELFNRSPLNERGWTLQERELSPRIIYFNKHTVLFECKEARGGERGDSIEGTASGQSRNSSLVLVPKLLIHSYDTRIARRALDPVAEGGKDAALFPSTTQKRYEAWREMVQGYSKRNLSVASDKLPALSGLASEFAYLLNDQYIAGLWKDDFIAGLCWSCEFKGRNYYGRQCDYGPSWSWAKMTVPISYENLSNYVRYRNNSDLRRMTRVCESRLLSTEPKWKDPTLLDFSTIPEGKDPNGTLISATLFIQGQIAPMKRLKTGNCMIGTETVDIIWDFLPQSSTHFYLLSLGKINIGLVLVRIEGPDAVYRRVGLAPWTKWSWFSDVKFEHITFV